MFLEVKDLNVDLGEFHLKSINLKIEKNEYMVIIGPTGSGKSVLLETIAGFYKQNSGQVFLEGRDISNLEAEKRGISIVYQDYVLFPNMNVFENIAYGLKKKIKDKGIINSKVFEIAELLKINHLLDRDPETLSGGEKQRTAIARSLIVEPNLLLMDEPFSAVDIETHAILTTLIKNVISNYQTTVIHVTHNFDDVWNLAESVAVMKDGKILQQGIVNEVFSKPSHKFVAEFVGVQNVFRGKVIETKEDLTTVMLEDGLLLRSVDGDLKRDDEVLVAIRPENIIISNETFVSSIRNQLQGTVEEIIKIGPRIWVGVQVNKTIFKGMITPSSLDILGIENGKKVYVSFKSLNVKIIDSHEAYHSII
ncbi:MAG TPA: ATP-binding cassette domain-containing protein [Methanobacterium sp.]|nr:ATP-binding cassette domain-containing protein [Methanobacterium sp.]